MGVVTALAIAGAAAGIGGTVMQARAQRDHRKASRRAAQSQADFEEKQREYLTRSADMDIAESRQLESDAEKATALREWAGDLALVQQLDSLELDREMARAGTIRKQRAIARDRNRALQEQEAAGYASGFTNQGDTAADIAGETQIEFGRAIRHLSEDQAFTERAVDTSRRNIFATREVTTAAEGHQLATQKRSLAYRREQLALSKEFPQQAPNIGPTSAVDAASFLNTTSGVLSGAADIISTIRGSRTTVPPQRPSPFTTGGLPVTQGPRVLPPSVA